jgi:hypothetical protein
MRDLSLPPRFHEGYVRFAIDAAPALAPPKSQRTHMALTCFFSSDQAHFVFTLTLLST